MTALLIGDLLLYNTGTHLNTVNKFLSWGLSKTMFLYAYQNQNEKDNWC